MNTSNTKNIEGNLEAYSGFLLSNSQYATHHYTKTDIPKTHSSFLSSANLYDKRVIHSINITTADFTKKAPKSSSNYDDYEDQFEFTYYDQNNKNKNENERISAFSRISEIVPSTSNPITIAKSSDNRETLNFKFKLVLLGDYGTGKSTLFKSLINGGKETLMTVVHNATENNALISIKLDEKIQITLDLWDTSGEEKYGQPTNQFFREADGILLCYDIANSKSFVSLSRWINIITSNTIKPDVVIVLIGNKNDTLKRQISFEDSSYFARSNRLDLIEVSSFTSKNTDLTLEFISRCMVLALEEKNMKVSPNCESVDIPFNINQEVNEKQVHESQLEIFENLLVMSNLSKFNERASIIKSKSKANVIKGRESITITRESILRGSLPKKEKSNCC